METLFELLFEFFGEFILQVLFEWLAEAGWRRLPDAVHRPMHPLASSLGHAGLGAIAGVLSLWWFPTLFIRSHAGQVASAAIVPLMSGAAMAALGRWRRRRAQTEVLLDRFAYAFIFALAMSLVRLRFGA